MTEIFELTWRAYPAAVLIAAGVVTALWSAARAVRRARLARDPQRVLAILQGFRVAVVALAVAGLGLSCWLQSASLFGLALIIGGEELLESSVMIAALKTGRERNASGTTRRAWERGRPARKRRAAALLRETQRTSRARGDLNRSDRYCSAP